MAGNGIAGDGGEGVSATSAQLEGPVGLAFDSTGNLFISDIGAWCIRKVNTAGIITRVAGNGMMGYSGDEGPALSAEFYEPYGITIGPSGDIFIADMFNNVIRKVDTAGIIHTVAGTGGIIYNGEGIPAATANLFSPIAVLFDSAGNLYISENMGNRIRQVDALGDIYTITGNGINGTLGDGGPATLAGICRPSQMALDAAGSLFFSDNFNSRVRKITTGGTILAAVGVQSLGAYSGDGGPALSAQLHSPVGLAFDAAGDLFIADHDNHCIRKVDTAGIITTVVGDGTPGYSGDGGPPATSRLSGPTGIAFDSAGNLYIADTDNHRIRKVCFNN